MVGSIHIRQDGVWEQIHQMYVKDADEWKDPAAVWVKDGGLWHLVYPPVALDLDFTKMIVLDPRITFWSDGGPGMYHDVAGKLRWAPQNYVLQSENFATSWVKGAGGTITVNATTAPDGNLTADQFNHTTAGDVPGANMNLDIVGSTTFVGAKGFFSIYAKAGTKNWLCMGNSTIGGNFIWFNILNGTVGVVQPNWFNAGIQNVGNGWFRCYGAWGGGNGPNGVYLRMAEADGSANCISTGHIFLWGAQLENTTDEVQPKAYMGPTTTVGQGKTARLDYDPFKRRPVGICIEGFKQNYFTHSENHDTTGSLPWPLNNVVMQNNAIVGMDGVLSGDKMLVTGSPAYIWKAYTGTAGVPYAHSIYVKRGTANWLYIMPNILSPVDQSAAWFNLATGQIGSVHAALTAFMHPVGNGWYKCTVMWLTAATVTGSGRQPRFGLADNDGSVVVTAGKTAFIWGKQANNFTPPNVYISSHVTASNWVTAQAAPDNAVMTGANFSDWYDHNGGTFVVEFDLFGTGGTKPILLLDDGTANESIAISVIEGICWVTVVSAGVMQANFSFGNVTAFAPHRVGLSYRLNDYAACLDGGTVALDTVGTVPTPTQMYIGRGAGSLYLCGHIARIQFFHRTMGDIALQQLTAFPVVMAISLVWTSDNFDPTPAFSVTFTGGRDGDTLELKVSDDPYFISPHGTEQLRLDPFTSQAGVVSMGNTIPALAPGVVYYARVDVTRGNKLLVGSNIVEKGIYYENSGAWNPADSSLNIVLSQNNRVANSLLAGVRSIRGIPLKASGKVHVEFRRVTGTATNWGFGIANLTAPLNALAGATSGPHTMCIFPNGNIYTSSTIVGSAGAGYAGAGAWYAVEIDFDAKTLKFWKPLGGGWTNTVGFGGISSPWYLFWQTDTINNDVEINTGNTAWEITPSHGFNSGWW